MGIHNRFIRNRNRFLMPHLSIYSRSGYSRIIDKNRTGLMSFFPIRSLKENTAQTGL